ncbi:MAG: hypothetical protein WBB28_28200 [Crinalium sp.]
MFSKFKLPLIAVLLGLNTAPARTNPTEKPVQIPLCRLDQTEFKRGWFVQVGDISKVMAVQSRLPPGATLMICQTSWFNRSQNGRDVVIEVGKFLDSSNAKNFGAKLWLEVSPNISVKAGPPSGM